MATKWYGYLVKGHPTGAAEFVELLIRATAGRDAQVFERRYPSESAVAFLLDPKAASICRDNQSLQRFFEDMTPLADKPNFEGFRRMDL